MTHCQFRSKYLYFLFIYLFSLMVLLILHGRYLVSWQLFSDDLFVLSYAENLLARPLAFITDMSGQYRPIPYLIYALYLSVVTHAHLLYFINLSLFALAPALFMRLIKSLSAGQSKALPFVFILPYLLSPIFFYPVYNLSSLSGTLMLVIFTYLLSLLLKPGLSSAKPLIFALVLVCVSVFIKESCLVAGLLFGLILIKNRRSLKANFIITAFCVLAAVFGLYGSLRLTSYSSPDNNYRYSLNLSTLASNVLHFSAWLNDYPKGWQYGTPVTPRAISLPLSLIQVFVWLTLIIFAAKSSKTKFQYLVSALLITMLPYLFLNRVLVFYLDQTYTILLLLAVLGWLELRRRFRGWAYIILTVFVAGSVIKAYVFLPQWHQYSFVGVAQHIAQNYLNVLKQNRSETFPQICIVEHREGTWATEYGRLAYRLYQVPVVSSADSRRPQECLSSALFLKNDGRNYLPLNSYEL